MKLNKPLLYAAALSVFFSLMASSAFGQATRTWVSGVGDDANPCARTAPCKTFAGAIAKTATGGEIDVLDPGGFGALTITKSISIESVGVVAGVLVSGTSGIVVNAPGAVVVLRGLTFEGLGSSLNGIELDAGAALYVQDCTINAFQNGIYIDPTSGQSNVFVSNTIVRNSSANGILFNPSGSAKVLGSLDNVKSENNAAAGVGANVTASAQANISVQSSRSANNGTGILASGGAGLSNLISLSEVTVFGNTIGLSAQSGGRILSFENNKILDNETNGVPSGMLAPQ